MVTQSCTTNMVYRHYRLELLGLAVERLAGAILHLNESDALDPEDPHMHRYQKLLSDAERIVKDCRQCDYPEIVASFWKGELRRSCRIVDRPMRVLPLPVEAG